MDHLLPHPPFAEDQPYPYQILTAHVLLRGFQTGSLLGPAVGLASHRYLARVHRLRVTASAAAAGPSPGATTTAAAMAPAPRLTSTQLLRATGTTGVGFTALAGAALVARMWGREEIEWKDRSWRLLGNEGQNGVDLGWVVGGLVGGVVVGGRGGGGWKVRAGGVGVGGLVGVVGLLGWRYGIRGEGEGE